jgi:folylpolyglutamate synthase/dihydropteroate synthase
MVQVRRAGTCEAAHLAALWIDTEHDVSDGAVLAGSVHGLKNDQQRIAVVGVMEALQVAEFFNMFLENLLVLFF